MKLKLIKLIALISLNAALYACGGGGDTTTGSGGAPSISNKCSISELMPSSGTTATLSKSSDQLTASFTLTMNEASSIETSANFENANADDWIEGSVINTNLAIGTYNLEVIFDLNSPSKSTADLYTKLSLTINLPDDAACVSNQTVNITLNP